MSACLPLAFINLSAIQEANALPISKTRILIARSYNDIHPNCILLIGKVVTTL